MCFFQFYLKEPLTMLIVTFTGISIKLEGKEKTLRVATLTCAMDLIAKAEFSNMATHSGHFGCKYCLIDAAQQYRNAIDTA